MKNQKKQQEKLFKKLFVKVGRKDKGGRVCYLLIDTPLNSDDKKI